MLRTKGLKVSEHGIIIEKVLLMQFHAILFHYHFLNQT